MTSVKISTPFAVTIISLILLLGTTLLLSQILQVEDFLLSQYVRTSGTVNHIQDTMLEMRMSDYAASESPQP